MLHPPSVGAAPTAPCTSISSNLGLRCDQPADHGGDHRFGRIIWPTAPPAAPAPPTSLERVLRLAARLLPCTSANPGVARLDRIAAELRGVRVYYLHDVETCAAIDAWLELWGSR